MTNQTTTTNNSQMTQGFPGNMLKIFAALTMLIDHAALTVVYTMLAKQPDYLALVFSTDATTEELAAIPADYFNLYTTYTVMRLVGRIAFPIFAFLLYEGFLHTQNIKKYLLRLGILALVSELPYNLIVSTVNTGTASLFYPQLQNTVFTLFLGLLTLCGMKHFECTDLSPKATMRQMFGQLLIVCVAAVLAIVCRTDYSYLGILLIAVFYFFRNSKKLQILLGCILFLGTNVASLLAFIPIGMYNGMLLRSKKFQYFFYIFYPVHLLALYVLSRFV